MKTINERSFKKEKCDLPYTKLSTKTIRNKELSVSAKLILVFLKLNVGSGMYVKTMITEEVISDILGYSINNVRSKLSELDKMEYIDIERSANGSKRIKITVRENPEKFERFTAAFMHSRRICTRDKEFILLVSPIINLNSDTVPFDNEEIAERIGLSASTVRVHILSLKKAGYWLDNDSGRHLYLLAIMQDICTDHLEEVYRLKETIYVKDQIIKHQRVQINELTNKLKKYENE